MILASNVIVAPIQLSVYLASLSVINGATSLPAIIKFVRMSIFGIMKVAWITGPASLVAAQKFLPAETWVPFLSFVNFLLGERAVLFGFTKERRRSRG
jgi:peroxisomal membrane protein 2